MAKRKPATSTAGATAVEAAPSEYTVLARRYRPQQFSDLVGQEPVAQALINALQTNRVAHAYLFTGARGVGKTSTARILAKALNCEKGPTPTPCDRCDMCQAIASGDDVDVLEIDGASNRGIDEVRELRQNVQFRPSRSRYKIYIIDEVHMLTREAFNALLKTLEEPPGHVKFIFATTEVNKIPITILSRCQRFDFAGIGLGQIVSRLREVVGAEKMQADDDALELIARRAGGSMRDAQSLLDQLLAFGSEKLTRAQVHKLLGTADEERVAALAEAVLDQNAGKALELLERFLDEGCQLGELVEQLLEYWRDLMVLQATGQEKFVLSVVGKGRTNLQQHAAKLSLDTILAGLDVLASAKSRLRATSHGRVVLEMALVRLARLDNLVPLAQLVQSLGQGSGGAPRSQASALPAPTKAAANAAAGGGEGEKKKEVSEAPADAPTAFGPLTPETLPDFLPLFLSQIGLGLSIELRRSEIAISGPNTLVLRFPAGYNFQLDSIKQSRLEETARALTGQNWFFRAETGPATVSATTPQDSPVVKARRKREELSQLPLVKKAMELLEAQVVKVDDDFGSGPPENTPVRETALEEGE